MAGAAGGALIMWLILALAKWIQVGIISTLALRYFQAILLFSWKAFRFD
jgi:hypothetical protein